jgi:hypothetical protein
VRRLDDDRDPSGAVLEQTGAVQDPRRHQQLTAEIDELDTLIAPLTVAVNPALCGLLGVGPDVAGQLLITAGQNPDRLRSDAAFAMLCGVAPLPASSGRTHRLPAVALSNVVSLTRSCFLRAISPRSQDQRLHRCCDTPDVSGGPGGGNQDRLEYRRGDRWGVRVAARGAPPMAPRTHCRRHLALVKLPVQGCPCGLGPW